MTTIEETPVEADAPNVDTPTPEANGNGSAPAEVGYADGDGIEYLKNGGARVTVDGAPYTLRPPTVGMFKALNARWASMVGKESTEMLDMTTEWVKFLFNGDDDHKGLSDHKLDDDSDNWPSWLGMVTYFPPLMAHFRQVPLAPGGTATA